jgi:hypothetical protein
VSCIPGSVRKRSFVTYAQYCHRGEASLRTQGWKLKARGRKEGKCVESEAQEGKDHDGRKEVD